MLRSQLLAKRKKQEKKTMQLPQISLSDDSGVEEVESNADLSLDNQSDASDFPDESDSDLPSDLADSEQEDNEENQMHQNKSLPKEEQERTFQNTVGYVNMDWYKEFPHIGYDIDGNRIFKPANQDELDTFLDKMEDPDDWRTFFNKYEGKKFQLSPEEVEIIRRITSNSIPDVAYDPYEPTIEWFTSQQEVMPLSARPEPKHRFTPSKHEAKRIMKMVKAIREGRIILDRPVEVKQRFYSIWDEANDKETEMSMKRIAPPKLKLPETNESYNPPAEYLMTEEEIKEWEAMDPEDRDYDFIPKKFNNLRSVPAYERFIRERYDRCLDLYMCPRMIKKRLNIDPESLIPKLPDPKDLKPFPTKFAVEYKGHSGYVRSISVDPLGQWLVSSSDDKTVRLWEVSSGRCMQTWEMEESPLQVAWNLNRLFCMFAVTVGDKVLVIVPNNVDAERKEATRNQIAGQGPEGIAAALWQNSTVNESDQGIVLRVEMKAQVVNFTWHKKGDYFATVSKAQSAIVLIHQLSKRQSQSPFSKNKGVIQKVMFHPSKPLFFVASQKLIRIYDLIKQQLVKKLEPNVDHISSIDIHPQGDNVIAGAYDRLLTWFDLDLSSKPYKSIRPHDSAVRHVTFHKRYPLFATCGDEGEVHVYHGMVYNDLLQNPLIVPLKIIPCHTSTDQLGVLCCEFHPMQPWVFSSGADGRIKLFC